MSTRSPADELTDYRAMARHEMPGAWYRGWAHAAWSVGGALGLASVALTHIHSLSLLELFALPAAALFANLVEHQLHHRVLHRPGRGLLHTAFERHARQHHRFFVETAMGVQDHRDWYMVLFPPWALPLVLVGLAPVLLGLQAQFGTNTALLFGSGGLIYFAAYEALHLVFHLDPDSDLGRLSLIRFLRRHHARHHNPRLMGRYNFNVVFPLVDWVLDTRHQSE